MDTAEVGGLRIAYERAGRGPCVVLLHGFVGGAKGTWARQIEALSDEFTVVAWDAPGSGRSTDPPESFRMPEYADCLASFITALGLRTPHVVGLSFGGALALELYRRHRAVPRTLVLAGAYAGWAGSLAREVVDDRLELSLRLSELPGDEFAASMVPSMFSESAPAEAVAAFRAAVSELNSVGFRVMTRALAEADLRDVLPEIIVPTLLLYGDEDARAPLDVAEAIHRAVPASKLVVMPGVGHVSSVEAPEQFTDEVRQFLRAH